MSQCHSAWGGDSLASRIVGSDRCASYRLPTSCLHRGHRHRPLEFGDALQCCAPQALRIARDVALPVTLEVGHPAIKRLHEFKQVADEGLVQFGWHRCLSDNECAPTLLKYRNE